jgi:hypothetical protein
MAACPTATEHRKEREGKERVTAERAGRHRRGIALWRWRLPCLTTASGPGAVASKESMTGRGQSRPIAANHATFAELLVSWSDDTAGRGRGGAGSGGWMDG